MREAAPTGQKLKIQIVPSPTGESIFSLRRWQRAARQKKRPSQEIERRPKEKKWPILSTKNRPVRTEEEGISAAPSKSGYAHLKCEGAKLLLREGRKRAYAIRKRKLTEHPERGIAAKNRVLCPLRNPAVLKGGSGAPTRRTT